MVLPVQAPPPPPPPSNDGCLVLCMKGLYHLIEKICSAVVAVFRTIFCCARVEEPLILNVPPRIVRLLPPREQVAPPVNVDMDVETLQQMLGFADDEAQKNVLRNALREKGVEPVEPAKPPEPTIDQVMDTLDVDTLQQMLAFTDDEAQKNVFRNALRKKGVVVPEPVQQPAQPRIRILPLDPRLNRVAIQGGILPVQPPEMTPNVGAPAGQGAGIPLRPTQLPVGGNKVEQVECPVAPIRMVGKRGNGNAQQLIQLIKQEIQDDSHWLNLEIYNSPNYNTKRHLNQILDSCDLLTQENWIQMLNEIPHTERPAPIIEPTAAYGWDGRDQYNLDEATIKRGFYPDREVVLKLRLAYLALQWVQAKQGGIWYPNSHHERVRDNSPEHPFCQLYRDIGPKDNRDYNSGEETILGFQEEARFLPLIRAFAAQKKEILVRHPNLQERRLEVNYLSDLVLLISQGLTGILTYNIAGISKFKNSRSGDYVTVNFKELNSDKIGNGIDTFWNTYLCAKANNDLKNFVRACGGVCHDARITALNEYARKFADQHPDFILKLTELLYDREGKYYNLFIYEQIAIYCSLQEPKLKYDDFKDKIMAERGSEAAKTDPVHIDFFKNYASEARFKAWAIQFDKDNRDQRVEYPSIVRSPDGKDIWQETLDALESMSIEIDPLKPDEPEIDAAKPINPADALD